MTVARLVDAATIAARVAELATDLDADLGAALPAETPAVCVGVWQGAIPLLADLTRAMHHDVEIEMLGVTRFGDGGRVRLAMDVATDLTGRHVVLVEDLVDTGLTLRSILAQLATREPASVRVVALLDRRVRRLVDVTIDHAGFEIGDEFVIGYGLDWEDRYRNLPDLWTVLDLTAFTADPPALEASEQPPVLKGTPGPVIG